MLLRHTKMIFKDDSRTFWPSITSYPPEIANQPVSTVQTPSDKCKQQWITSAVNMSYKPENADSLFPSDEEVNRCRHEDKKSRKRKTLPSMPVLEPEPVPGPSRDRSETVSKPPPAKKPYFKPIPSPASTSQLPRLKTASELFGEDSDDDEPMPPPAIAHVESNPMARKEQSYEIHCQYCQKDIPKNEYQYHIRTNFHKSQSLLQTKYQNIEIIATAFKNRIVSYKLNPSEDYLTPEEFLLDNKNEVIKVISILLKQHHCIKVNFELFACFVQPKSGEEQLKSFNTKYQIIYNNTDIVELYKNIIDYFGTKMTEFQHQDSGWSCLSMSHLEININKYSPLRGGTYLDLPYTIKSTKSCLNIQNNDECCFLWSIVAAMYPAKNNVCRVSSYPHYMKILKTDGMSFPPSHKDIKLFEKINSTVSINIYGLDEKNVVTGPLYMTEKRKEIHVNLLFIERDGKAHYCLIKDLLRLVKRQVTHHKGKMYLCESCLQFFTNDDKYNSHICPKILTILPDKNSYIQFKNYERQQMINFVVYADFESILIDCDDEENNTDNTKSLKRHEPSCFGYYISCSHDSTLNKYVTYRGPDSVKVFIDKLINDIQDINKIISYKKSMTPLTKEQEDNYINSKVCHICKNFLFDDKVRDHDHITSQYRGAAHSHCNLMYRVCSFVPVIFHNLIGYDSHLFIKELANYEGSLKIIPKTKEKYLSITKTIESKSGLRPIQIKFIDSFQFLSSGLDVLCRNLSDKDFINLSKEFPEKEKCKLLSKKGIYPYDYIDSFSKYNESHLPSKAEFYNTLKSEYISDNEYAHAQTVWQTFNIQSLGEYTDLYLKSDVLLLCDVFENFRRTSMQHYKLDPAYYISAPSLSWDAMLLYTGVKLELISDLEIYELIEKGIRGGLSQCSLRYAKANNKYMPDFNSNEESTFLFYCDCNNLYGHSMMQNLPIADFRLLSSVEIENLDIMNVSNNSKCGYILEVDLSYPDYLHERHSDLPFAVEKFTPIGGKTPKLIANLYDKYKYVIHYVHLQECINNGLVLKKIHRALSFTQASYLKKYIDLNTRLRQASTSNFEKDFFKLLNNAIFGKTIENRRKQVNVKLVTTWNDKYNTTNKYIGAEKLIAKPNLKSITVFSENFVAIHLNQEKIVLDRPIYIGFTVLEYAKQHLYNFHYNYMKKKYQNNVKLCYTDTDSLLYLIKSNDYYKDLKNDVWSFDTSNYRSDNEYNIPRVNEKVPGLFKDELGGEIITEFIGLKAKLYCISTLKNQIKKAKGASKSVTKRLQPSDYNKSLKSDTLYKFTMHTIKSIKHVLYSQEVNKIVLNRKDDKRQILKNKIDTLPWGHCNSVF